MAKLPSYLAAAITLSLFASTQAFAMRIVERRNWLEKGVAETAIDQCKDEKKQWRCIFTERTACEAGMLELSKACKTSLLPDLPEYIDSAATKERAQKVVVECLSAEFTKKHLIGLSKEKMDDYNVCTGVAQRRRPLSPGIVKAQEFSSTQLVFTCAADGFLRRCHAGVNEGECKGLIDRVQTDCAMRFEDEGVKVGKDNTAQIQEAGKKITDCALADAKKELSATRPKSSRPDCN